MSLTPEPPATGIGPATPPHSPTADAGPLSPPLPTAPGSVPPSTPAASAQQQMRATWSGVTVTWHERWLFKDFSYAVPDGGIVGIVGPRGPSMDAALLALVGRYPLEAGSVTIVDAPDTVVIAHVDNWELDDPLLTVGESVMQTAQASAPATSEANVARCITAVGLHELADTALGALTSPQLIRTGLAAAAATGANVIAVNASGASGEPDEDEFWLLLTQLAGTGRLVLASNPRPHPAMNLVLSIPHGVEVPS